MNIYEGKGFAVDLDQVIGVEKWESEMITSLAEIMVRHNLTAHDMLSFMANASCYWVDRATEQKPPTMKLV